MSAITGIFYRKGKKVDPQLIQKMNDKLSHRGPDGSHTWVEDNVGLGHQMLHTTPESLHEKLPFIEEDRVITADARIDNREELANELDIADVETVSDSYFILKAYGRWGEDCPDKLLGDFAFAIWDRKKEILFCARDHMGVKPFYYYVDEEMFVFGTEIKALFEVGGVPREVNENRVALYFMKETSYNEKYFKESTFYENISYLDSAQIILLKSKSLEKREYWKLDPFFELNLESDEEYAKAFTEIFFKAVECRLRSHMPVGSELSGGIDSSSIVCMAEKIFSETKSANPTKIKTFSRIFDETPESDERFYIKKVISREFIEPNFVNVDQISPLEDIENILWHQDQPFYTPHMTKQIKTYKEIKKKGVRVLLSGQGGDQNVSMGTKYIRELAVTFNLKKLWSEISGRSKNFNEPKLKIMFDKVLFPSLPYFLKKIIRIVLNKDNLILSKYFLNKCNIDKERYNISLDELNKMKSKEYHNYVINYSFNESVFGSIDRSSSTFSIEVRYPFFDKRLVEFCYALPTDMKLRKGWDRYVMRLGMKDILPKEIYYRATKADLSHSYIKNLFLFEEDKMERLFEEKNINKYFNLEKIQNFFKNPQLRNDKNLFEIWLIVLLVLWAKKSKLEK